MIRRANAILVGLLLLAGSAKAAELASKTFTNRAGFRITFPAGWQEFSEVDVKLAYETMNRQKLETNGQSLQLFQTAPAEKPFHLPYVIVSTDHSRRYREADVVRAFATTNEYKKRILEDIQQSGQKLEQDFQIHQIQYDPTNHLLLTRETYGDMERLSAMCLTEFGCININCWTGPKEMDSLVDLFKNVVGSVQILEEYRYKPRRSDSSEFWFAMETVDERLSRWMPVITVVAVCIGLLLYGRRKLR